MGKFLKIGQEQTILGPFFEDLDVFSSKFKRFSAKLMVNNTYSTKKEPTTGKKKYLGPLFLRAENTQKFSDNIFISIRESPK